MNSLPSARLLSFSPAMTPQGIFQDAEIRVDNVRGSETLILGFRGIDDMTS